MQAASRQLALQRHKAFTPSNSTGNTFEKNLLGNYLAMGDKEFNLLDIDEQIRAGLPANVFDLASDSLDVSKAFLANLIGLSTSTLNRRKKNKQPLTPTESDALARVFRVHRAACQLLGNSKDASKWITQPAYSLGNKTPLELTATSAGTDAVLDFIDGLEYGVFA